MYYVKEPPRAVRRRYPALLIVYATSSRNKARFSPYIQVRRARLGDMQICLGKTTLKNELNKLYKKKNKKPGTSATVAALSTRPAKNDVYILCTRYFILYHLLHITLRNRIFSARVTFTRVICMKCSGTISPILTIGNLYDAY